MDEYGERDDFALSYGYCNGPLCTACSQAYCKWCTPGILDADDCPGE